MAKQRTSFAKLQRDRAKAAKKAAKQAKVQGKTDDFWGATGATTDEAEVETVTAPVAEGIEALFEGRGELSAPELLQMIDEIHAMKESGKITAEEFEDAKIEIFTRLPE